jgi:hypothetical protein
LIEIENFAPFTAGVERSGATTRPAAVVLQGAVFSLFFIIGAALSYLSISPISRFTLRFPWTPFSIGFFVDNDCVSVGRFAFAVFAEDRYTVGVFVLKSAHAFHKPA